MGMECLGSGEWRLFFKVDAYADDVRESLVKKIALVR